MYYVYLILTSIFNTKYFIFQFITQQNTARKGLEPWEKSSVVRKEMNTIIKVAV